MFRVVAFVSLSIALSLSAQQTPPPVPGTLLPPPPTAPTPVSNAPVIPVAPPMPGQLESVPTTPLQPPAPLPPMPATAPSVPVNKSKTVSSTSTSGQFIVHGDDLPLRSALSGKCEDIAAELRTLLHDKQPWALPIVVLLNTGDAARKGDKTVSTAISQLTHGGFHLQVNVNMRPDLTPNDLRRELIRALLAERILRDQKEITPQRKLLLPDWLFLGTMEALEYRQRARPSALFAAIFKSGKIFGIEEIIEASASDIDDGLSRTIYQTSCCALVMALLDQPESGLRMGKFLNALASDPRTERELLNQWFPNFATTDASLNKWWALQLATLASPGMGEPLSPADTIKALEDALTFRFQAKPSELPQTSRRVIAAVEPSAPRNDSSDGEAPSKPIEKAKPKDTETAPSGEAKPGFFSRLNPFSRGQSSDDEKIAAAIEEAARAEADNAPPGADIPAEPTETAPEHKPWLGRLFAGDDKEKPKSKDQPAAASKPEKKEASKAEKEKAAKPEEPKSKAEDEPEADKKPSTLNPLNWFRGGKKDKADKTEDSPAEIEAPAKDKKTALHSHSDDLASQLLAGGPILALVYQEIAVEAAPEKEKKRFFGLLGKKKSEDDVAEPEEPKKATPKPEESKPKETKPKEEKTDKAEGKSKGFSLHLPFLGGKKDDVEPAEDEAKNKPVETPPTVTPPAQPETPSKPKPAAKSASPESEATVSAAIPIEDYAVILKRKDLAKIIERNANILAALQNRGSVLFRPIVIDYVSALDDIIKGKTKGLDTRLQTLRMRTQQALEKSKAIRDLLDLHEANESPALSGLFEDYLKLPETIQKELPERNDPISKYLDALDKEFSKE